MIDLEDRRLLQDLHPPQTPVQTTSSAPPTSAQLHLLAASVTTSAPIDSEIRTEEQNKELPGTVTFYRLILLITWTVNSSEICFVLSWDRIHDS